ncbi:MAG: sodium:solute symporter family protein, partial [Candidatus Methanomethylophilaceae archaeon]|nr:sodium:solute symporter family protein [Candidatus Methanomethylophilaceae archaeon]
FMLVIVGSAYTVGSLSNGYFDDQYGMTSFQYITSLGLGTDFIVPQYILEVFSGVTFGDVFVSLFLLSLICASISTISALMHTIGAAGGYDLYEILKTRRGEKETHDSSVRVSRIVIVVMMVIVVIYCYVMPKDIIAKATSLFMGMTAAALLPAYFHALYSKNPSRDAALASISVGTVVYIFLALFINSGLSIFLPICKMITGQAVLMPDSLIAYVDPLIIALPISIITMAVVLLAKKGSKRVS